MRSKAEQGQPANYRNGRQSSHRRCLDDRWRTGWRPITAEGADGESRHCATYQPDQTVSIIGQRVGFSDARLRLPPSIGVLLQNLSSPVAHCGNRTLVALLRPNLCSPTISLLSWRPIRTRWSLLTSTWARTARFRSRKAWRASPPRRLSSRHCIPANGWKNPRYYACQPHHRVDMA